MGPVRRTGRALLIVSFAVVTAGIVLLLAQAHGGSPRPALSQSRATSEDLASLAIDMFVKGLNQNSDFLLRSSVSDSLYPSLRAVLDRMKGSLTVDKRSAATTSLNGGAEILPSLPRITFTIDTILVWEEMRTARGRFHVTRGGLCVSDSMLSIVVQRTPRGWRVTDTGGLDRILLSTVADSGRSQ